MSQPATTNDKLAQFTGKKYINIETYRKTGDPVRTPVWFVEQNGELFIRTDSRTGKVKRIRNNPRVRVVNCSAAGTPEGSWLEGEARLTDQGTAEHVFTLLKKKYGITYRMVRLLQRFSRSKARPVGLAIRTLAA